MIDEKVKIWTAGFFDGEGSITIRPSYPYKLEVSVCNKNRNSIELFLDTWGGHLYHDHQQGLFRDVLFPPNRELAKRFLSDIEPYVVIKKKHIEIALEYLERLAEFDGLRLKGTRLVGAEVAWRKNLLQRLSSLNEETENIPASPRLPQLAFSGLDN